jgi:hypothetical protein
MESDFRDQLLDKRAALFEGILAHVRQKGIQGKDLWSLKRDSVRFCLGESDYDIKIPFIFGGGSEEIFEEATRELASLMKGRLEPSMLYDNHGSIMIPVLDERVKLLPKGYRVVGEFKNRLETEIAVSTIYSDPLIDAGLISSWFSSTLHGRRFISELFRIYKKAIEEEMHLGGSERTSLLIHLAVSCLLGEKKEVIKGVKIRGVSYEKLERSISILYSNVVRAVITEILSAFKGKRLSYDFREMEYILLSTTTPLFILNIKSAVLGSDLNPYNLTPKIAARLEDVYDQAARTAHTIIDLTRGMADRIIEDKKLTELIIEFHNLGSFRDDILDYLISYDNQKEGIHILFSEIAQDDKLLRALWEDSKIASQVETGLSDLIDRYRRDEGRVNKIKKIMTNFKTHRRWGLIRLFSVGKETLIFQISEIVRRYIVYRMDCGYDSYFAATKRLLENRKRQLPLKELIREYDGGRLYRFAGDHKIFLVKTEEMKEGHLFVDLKGFTKRTKRSGSHVMADFLKNEFFLPILAAAKRYHLKIGREPTLGIELNNLLGDAISFSGNIVAIVELAKEIQIITSEYKRELLKNNPDFDEKVLRERLLADYKNDLIKITKEKKGLIDTIKALDRIVESKRSMSPQAMLEAQMKLFDETIQDRINSIAIISQKIKDAGKDPQRDKYLVHETEIREQLSLIKASRDELVEQVEKQNLVKRSKEFYTEICQDELNQINRLKGMLADIQMKQREITQNYYERVGEISDLGVNTGLYISYGGVSEVIMLYDDLWGDIKVNIADKINEASRGSQRNKNIKKRVERFIEKRRMEAHNPNLVYPFDVIVGNTLSIILPLDEEGDRFMRPVTDTLGYDRVDLLKDGIGVVEPDSSIVMSVGGGEPLDEGFVSESTDIYNLGEALSEDALREYIRGSRERFYFFDRRIQCRELNPEFNTIFAYDGTEVYLIFGVEQQGEGRHVEMFRYAGILDYAGTVKREVTEVYEIIRPDSLFYLFIMDRYFEKWYKASRSVQDVREGLLGT